MKVMIFGVCAAAFGGGWFLLDPYTPPNVYSMTPDQAYARLLDPIDVPAGGGPFNSDVDYHASGNGKDRVTWDAGMKGSGRGCDILIAPFDGGRARLDVPCPNVGEGAAAGLATNQRRNNIIELVDATMTGRAFDAQRAMGATAGKWPADTVKHGTIFDAQSQALEMQADMMRQQAEWKKQEAARPNPKPPGW